MTNSWRALARMARDRIVQTDPEDLSLVLNACIISYHNAMPCHAIHLLLLTNLPPPNSSGPSASPPSPVSGYSTKPQPKRPTCTTRSAVYPPPQRVHMSSSTSSPSNSTSYTHASSTGRVMHTDTQTRSAHSYVGADVAPVSPVLTLTVRCGSSARRA